MDVNGVVESVMQLMKKYSIRSPSFKMEPNLRFITQYVLLLKCRLVFIVLGAAHTTPRGEGPQGVGLQA